MSQGKVKWFNEQKGFGFISSESGTDYFVHHSSIIGDGYKSLPEGAEVQFETEETEKGMRAVQVSVV